jgi:hypothetical protein
MKKEVNYGDEQRKSSVLDTGADRVCGAGAGRVEGRGLYQVDAMRKGRT